MFAFVKGSPVFLRAPGRAEVAAVLQGLGCPGPRGETQGGGSQARWTVGHHQPSLFSLGESRLSFSTLILKYCRPQFGKDLLRGEEVY